MKTFWEDLGKKIGETTETVTSKAGEMVEIQRLKGQIRTLERSNEEDFLEMGRFLYHRFQAGEQLDEQMSTLCSKIEERIERIEKHQAQIEEIKGTSTCACCGRQVAKEMAFCPYCGAKKAQDIWDETETVIKEKADQAVDFVKEKAGQAAEHIVETTQKAADTVMEKTEDITEAAKEKAEEAAEKIKEFTEE